MMPISASARPAEGATGTSHVRAKLLYVGRGLGASRFELLTP